MVAEKTRSRSRKRQRKAKIQHDPQSPLNPTLSYTTEQLCAAVGVERTTIWRWRKMGLKATERAGRLFYRGRDVQKFLHG
jgi:hypothetical protein